MSPASDFFDKQCLDVTNHKRMISKSEKSQLNGRPGIAVVMPGLPVNGSLPEIDELVAVGYSLPRIVGVEKDDVSWQRILNITRGLVRVIHGDVADVITRLDEPISYVHLDYCGQLKLNELGAFSALCGRLTPVARVRATFLVSRQAPDQKKFLVGLAQELLLRAHLRVPRQTIRSHALELSVLSGIARAAPHHEVTDFWHERYDQMYTCWADLKATKDEDAPMKSWTMVARALTL